MSLSEIMALQDVRNAANPTSQPTTETLSSKVISMRANDIRSCGKNGDLRGAAKIFQRLGSQAETPIIVNSMLEACIQNKDWGWTVWAQS